MWISIFFFCDRIDSDDIKKRSQHSWLDSSRGALVNNEFLHQAHILQDYLKKSNAGYLDCVIVFALLIPRLEKNGTYLSFNIFSDASRGIIRRFFLTL